MEASSLLVLLLRCLVMVPLPLLLYRWYLGRRPFVDMVDKIPGYKTLPLIGNALNIIRNPVDMFRQLSESVSNFGPVFRFWVLDHPQVVIQRARDIEVVLQGMTHHHKGRNYRFLHPWMGMGLLTSSGETWRVHRKVLTPAFHFNILHEFLPVFTKHALKMTRCLAAERAASSDTGFNVFHYSSLCSLDIICESSMGTQINAQDQENSSYVNAVNMMNELLTRRYFSAWLRPDWMFRISPTRRATERHLRTLDHFTDQVIAERRKYLRSLKLTNGSVRKDTDIGERRPLAFLDLLLAAEEEGSEHMTQKDIRDQVATFMFEGHDTVSTAMCWALFLIGTYPDVQDRVVSELQSVFGEAGRVPDMSDLSELKFLERCIKESMRLYPSVPFYERDVREEAKIENFVIPAGCTVNLNIFMLHRDPEFWPDPERFDPDRFLPENVKGRHPYAYLPFSAGPRNCIGQKFALMEEKVVLSTVLRRFRVEAAHSREQAQLQVAMVLRPKNGLHIRLFDRETHPNLRVVG